MRTVWLLGLVAAVLLCGMAIYLSPLEPGVVALQLTFTPQAFSEVIHSWSPAHLARFRAHLAVDFVLLAVYGVFGYLFVKRARFMHCRPPAFRACAAWLLPAAAVFDAAENALHGWLTAGPDLGVPGLYLAAGVSATAKWALLLTFWLVVAWTAARAKA